MMDQYFRQNDGLLAAQVDGEILLFDASRGTYFATSGVGALVWDTLARPATLQEIIQAVMAACEVTRDVCEADVTAFLERLRAADLAVAQEIS
jgi:hypothetical protein